MERANYASAREICQPSRKVTNAPVFYSYSILSSILGVESAFFAVESSLEYINTDDVITFCLYLMNKMRLNLFKGLKIAHDLILRPVYVEVEDSR